MLRHLCKLVSTRITQLSTDTRLALALPGHRVAQLTGGPQREALTGQAFVRLYGLVVVVLAATLSCLFVTIRVKAVINITLTRPTYWVPPPLSRTWLHHLFLTIIPTEQR